jgi:hypothetical protein
LRTAFFSGAAVNPKEFLLISFTLRDSLWDRGSNGKILILNQRRGRLFYVARHYLKNKKSNAVGERRDL